MKNELRQNENLLHTLIVLFSFAEKVVHTNPFPFCGSSFLFGMMQTAS